MPNQEAEFLSILDLIHSVLDGKAEFLFEIRMPDFRSRNVRFDNIWRMKPQLALKANDQLIKILVHCIDFAAVRYRLLWRPDKETPYINHAIGNYFIVFLGLFGCPTIFKGSQET